jgi:hypothetical protein
VRVLPRLALLGELLALSVDGLRARLDGVRFRLFLPVELLRLFSEFLKDSPFVSSFGVLFSLAETLELAVRLSLLRDEDLVKPTPPPAGAVDERIGGLLSPLARSPFAGAAALRRSSSAASSRSHCARAVSAASRVRTSKLALPRSSRRGLRMMEGVVFFLAPVAGASGPAPAVVVG